MAKITIGTPAGVLDLDTDDLSGSTTRLSEYVASERQDAVAPVQNQLTAATAAVEELKGLVVDDVVRMRKLRSPETDAEKLTSHLLSFSPEQLKTERDAELAAFKSWKPEPKTENPAPADDDGDDANDFMP